MARAIDADELLKQQYKMGFRQMPVVSVDAIKNAPTLTPPNEPEHAGLYGKYTVYKNKDGSLVTDCFILRPAKDPAAVAALRAYAAATDNAELAADIINWVGAKPNEPLTLEQLRDMERINRFEKIPLTIEQVYTFSIRLCDNEVDRDYERFETAGLERLGELFLGKSGIFDHQWSARGQTARIYRTEVVAEPGRTTAAGDGYCYLKGWAYLLRTEDNAQLIAQIEGGIKKEVSVGCSVAESVCSVCGAPAGTCHHVKGEVYDGRLCFTELRRPVEAYEWAFVEAPTQRNQAHIDREAWMAEWTVDEFGHKCSKCGEYLTDGEYTDEPEFCPSCGRAMTSEAWTMLEKRLRG